MEFFSKVTPIVDEPTETYEKRRLGELLNEIKRLDALIRENCCRQTELHSRRPDSRVTRLNGEVRFRLRRPGVVLEPELSGLEQEHRALLAEWNRTLSEYAALKVGRK
jgi:hypothetical protein